MVILGIQEYRQISDKRSEFTASICVTILPSHLASPYQWYENVILLALSALTLLLAIRSDFSMVIAEGTPSTRNRPGEVYLAPSRRSYLVSEPMPILGARPHEILLSTPSVTCNPTTPRHRDILHYDKTQDSGQWTLDVHFSPSTPTRPCLGAREPHSEIQIGVD